MQMRRIREDSVKIARALGYPMNPDLPLLDEVKVVRSTSETLDRLLSLYAVVACSYGFSKEAAKGWLVAEGLSGALSEAESVYLDDPSPGHLDTSKQWQVECLWALAWCVGCHDHLDFSDSCPDNFIQMLPDIGAGEPSARFREGLQLREKSEIAAQADLAYCLHWAVRNAELMGQRPPGHIPGNVVVERRRALEWLIGQDAWDEIALDT